MGKVDINLTLDKRHKEWARENNINLSGWVRDRIDDELDQ